MYPIIHKYLLQHKNVSVPGVGIFTIENKPAFFNEQKSSLLAPQTQISYKAETALADRVFYDFLAKELRIDAVEAIKNFHEFTYQLKQDISHADAAVLPGIGTLTKQPDGSFLFEQENVLQDYFAAQPLLQIAAVDDASQISTSTNPNTNSFVGEADLIAVPEEEETTKKDYWWVYAIVLAVVGIAAILYKL